MTRIKDSGIEWIGEVPEEWGITKLKYICRMQSGNNLTSLEISSENDGGKIFPVYGGNGQRGYYSDFTNEGNYCLVGRQGALAGNVHFVSGKFWATDHAIVVYEHTHTYSKYLCYLLKAMNLNQYAFETSAQPGLSVEKILQLEMIHCPKGEQTQIADFLDKKVAQLDEVKSLLEEQIKTLEDYRRSLIYETVTKGLDKTVPLKDSGVDWIGQIPEGWNVDRLGFHIYEINEKNIPQKSDFILSLTNKDGVIPYEEKGNQGNNSKDNLLDYKLAYPDTIVANSMNILIGSVGYSNYFGCISPVYYVFKERKGTNLRFVNYIMATQLFQKELRKYANGILEIRLRVSSEDILKRFCAFPSLSDQDKIVSYLDKRTNQINQMIAIKKEQIENINKQRQTLIYDYVTGKRRV